MLQPHRYFCLVRDSEVFKELFRWARPICGDQTMDTTGSVARDRWKGRDNDGDSELEMVVQDE